MPQKICKDSLFPEEKKGVVRYTKATATSKQFPSFLEDESMSSSSRYRNYALVFHQKVWL